MLLLHAITPPTESALSDDRGLRGERLVAVAVAGLAVWVTDLASGLGATTREDLLAHHRLVMQIFSVVEACLPARFPTLVEDEQTLRTDIEGRAAELRAQLERVRDACELAVTAAWDPPFQESTEPVTGSSPGHRYLLERQQVLAGSDRRRALASQLADEIERSAGAALIEAQRKVCPSGTLALSLALLVKRPQAQIVKNHVPRTAESVRILVNGPWPPYTFSGIGSEQHNG